MTETAPADFNRAVGFGVVASLGELIGLRRFGDVRLPGRATSNAATDGSHPTPRRNRGIEFAGARPYQPGDDVRALDWRQTARRGRPYTKLFQEEQEHPLRLLVDLGPSMRFGTRVAFKSVLAARAAAVLAWRAAATGDRVGGLVWNGKQTQAIRPQGRQRGVLALLAALANASAAPPGDAVSMTVPLDMLAHTLRPGSLVVIASDFATLDDAVERRLAALAAGAELMLLHVYDAFEAQAPPPGFYRVTDGRRDVTLDLQSAAARSAYDAAFGARRTMLENLARRSGAMLLPLATDCPPAPALARVLPRWRVPAAQSGVRP